MRLNRRRIAFRFGCCAIKAAVDAIVRPALDSGRVSFTSNTGIIGGATLLPIVHIRISRRAGLEPFIKSRSGFGVDQHQGSNDDQHHPDPVTTHAACPAPFSPEPISRTPAAHRGPRLFSMLARTRTVSAPVSPPSPRTSSSAWNVSPSTLRGSSWISTLSSVSPRFAASDRVKAGCPFSGATTTSPILPPSDRLTVTIFFTGPPSLFTSPYRTRTG